MFPCNIVKNKNIGLIQTTPAPPNPNMRGWQETETTLDGLSDVKKIRFLPSGFKAGKNKNHAWKSSTKVAFSILLEPFYIIVVKLF